MTYELETSMGQARVQSRRGHALKGARSGNEQGFTLLETVIAMVVMMTVGLGASSLFLYSISNNAAAGARAQALAVAQRQIEQLRSVPFSDPLLAATAAVSTTVDSGSVAANTDARGSSVQVVVTKTVVNQNNVTVNGVTQPSSKLITITVAPVVSNARWASAPVTIITERSTSSRGPY